MIQRLVILFCIIAISSQAYANTDLVEEYTAEFLNNDGKKIGKVLFRQGTEGLLIRVDVKQLKPGIHGMQFHDNTSCNDNYEVKISKDQPTHNEVHGYFNPEGPKTNDLPNLIVGKDGSANVEIYTNFVSLSGQAWKPELMDENGSALIVFENEDDHFTQPIGNAGKKIACAIIQQKKPNNNESSNNNAEHMDASS